MKEAFEILDVCPNLLEVQTFGCSIFSVAYKVCLNSKFPPTLHSTLEIQPATLFGEKCVRLYLLGYLSITVFTTQNFRIKEKNENFF
jgi:hypothetical protein